MVVAVMETVQKQQRKFTQLSVSFDAKDRLARIARAKRWNLKVATEAAIEALEREQAQPREAGRHEAA